MTFRPMRQRVFETDGKKKKKTFSAFHDGEQNLRVRARVRIRIGIRVGVRIRDRRKTANAIGQSQKPSSTYGLGFEKKK